MARYFSGACILLHDEEDEENVIFCEILSYQGSGYYHVSLTRDMVNRVSQKFPAITSIHESALSELEIPLNY